MAAQLAHESVGSESDARSRAGLGDAAAKAVRAAATRPTSFTESSIVHFVQADLRPRDVRDLMCVKGERIAHDGSGNQTPLGGKFTRTCPRGENCGAFQTVGYARCVRCWRSSAG